MDEPELLKQICCGEQSAMETAVKTYAAYVVAVIHRRGGGILTPEDEEELASDVFFSLWQSAACIRGGKLTAWLGRVAVNKTVDFLRRRKQTLPLEETVAAGDDPLWKTVARIERAEALRSALQTLSATDREIFHRFYDLRQTDKQIAAALHMRAPTVRTRLRRGRESLRQVLCQGGITNGE